MTHDRPIQQAARDHSSHGPGAMSSSDWEDSYTTAPHWDLGRPQAAFRALADAGAIRGRVLDIGCGTGEHVLMCAALGLDATGVDFASAALHAAQDKARDRALTARFLLRDARRLADLADSFDTALDSGLFHIFGDEDRATYVDSVRSVLVQGGRYFILCFSDQQPGDQGPRRITRNEITTSFAEGWRIDSIEPTTLDSHTDRAGIRAWLLALTRI
jgi:cyclopropane fatty-acyl-phospholipid synthase-like methyltransferase